MLDLKKLVEGMNLDRDLVFVSLSSKDKDVALKLIRKLGEMRFKHWCMYHENGLDRNISGDVYTQTISGAISHCCIFIYLMSKHSLSSPQVKIEIEQISQSVKSGHAKVIPIFVDDTPNEDIPREITELTGIAHDMIIRRYNESTGEREMNSICEEIKEQYFNIIFDTIKRKFTTQKNSQKFNELMSACVKNKCTACSISDDIKESTEISADSLKEMHVISNEMLEYDCNTYSCMVIASNLLGAEESVKGMKIYNPDKNGVKYFYYVPVGYELECATAFDKLKEFVKKTKNSRREVTSLIRREFSSRNKVATFFREFNNMTITDFKEQYHVETPDDLVAFNELFCSELSQSYFAYSDTSDVFSIPEEFLAWISGDNEKYSYNTMIEISYEFIDFIGSFVDFLSQAKDINNVSYELLKKRYTYLERFRRLEDWQMGKLHDISVSESKRLANYLLDYTADSNNKCVKKFPRLANWMQFNYDMNGKVCELDDATVERALDNLTCIVVNEDESLRLCYSFALFIGRTEACGAWYTTGGSIGAEFEENTVTTYSFERQTAEYSGLLDALSYMISINPQAKEILKKHNSDLLHMLQEYKKRGAHK